MWKDNQPRKSEPHTKHSLSGHYIAHTPKTADTLVYTIFELNPEEPPDPPHPPYNHGRAYKLIKFKLALHSVAVADCYFDLKTIDDNGTTEFRGPPAESIKVPAGSRDSIWFYPLGTARKVGPDELLYFWLDEGNSESGPATFTVQYTELA